MSGREDDEIQDYFIRTAFPPLQVMLDAVKVLEKAGTMTLGDLGGELNYSRGALEKALKLLEVEGAVQREKAGFSRTANPWRPEAARFEQVTGHRRAELAEMQRYVEHTGCLMEFLARALDDPAAAPCGKCMSCTGNKQRQAAPLELVQEAVNFLRHDALVLEPRKWWPKPLLEELENVLSRALERFESGRPKSVIPERLQAQPGQALCIYGDAGWGQEVAQGKYETGKFSDALVKAAAELVARKWRPQPAPEWVVPIPSQRHAQLVQDFASRLAVELGLKCVPLLRKSHEKRPQKEMQNSAMQLRNVLNAFRVVEPPGPGADGRAAGAEILLKAIDYLNAQLQPGPDKGPALPPVPILLVDDMVDSGWTLTVAAVLLQLHGSGPVHPFALAKASPRGG